MSAALAIDDSGRFPLAIGPDARSGNGVATMPSAGACRVEAATHWNVAKIRPGAEHELPGYLASHGFPTLCPMLLVRNTKHHIVRTPLFVGYLFVRFDRRVPGWHIVRRAVGVAYLLGGPDGMPCAVPVLVMSRLLERPEIEAPGARAPAQGKQTWHSLGAMTPDERKALLRRWLGDGEG